MEIEQQEFDLALVDPGQQFVPYATPTTTILARPSLN